MNYQLKLSMKFATKLAMLFIGTIALASVSLTAQAQQQAYTNKLVNLRAGPDKDYPIVQQLPRGTAVLVMGCLENYRWCDVTAGASRGWVYAGNIFYAYQGSPVPLLTYGPVIGIGVTAFMLDSYWDNYYTRYPWYPQREYWINRPHFNHGYDVRHGGVPSQSRPVAAPRQPQVRAPQRHTSPPNSYYSAPRANVSPVRP